MTPDQSPANLETSGIVLFSSSINTDCKGPQLFVGDNRNVIGTKCMYHVIICNLLSMLLVHAAITIISMIVVVATFKQAIKNNIARQPTSMTRMIMKAQLKYQRQSMVWRN